MIEDDCYEKMKKLIENKHYKQIRNSHYADIFETVRKNRSAAGHFAPDYEAESALFALVKNNVEQKTQETISDLAKELCRQQGQGKPST